SFTGRRDLLAPLFPYTTLFRSGRPQVAAADVEVVRLDRIGHLLECQPMFDQFLRVDPDLILFFQPAPRIDLGDAGYGTQGRLDRSEEHTSELQSLAYLVCRLLL